MTDHRRTRLWGDGRYGSEEMRFLLGDLHRYQLFVRVEGALATVQGRLGVIPAKAAEVIGERAGKHECDMDRVAELETVSRHELHSVVKEFADSCAPYGRYVHHGATSSDVIDTALALQLDGAIVLLAERLGSLMATLRKQIEKEGRRVMIGRTHGQHAQPVTLGFKLAVALDQLTRCLERLGELRGRAVMGKMAGAVGSMGGLGAQGPRVQSDVLALLGLPEPRICAQAVARDRIAEFVCWTALTAACLENLATEIRNLQRTEIGELAESFAEGDQIGSSAMPHKRNPVRSERICSLARLVRSLTGPALENVVTWHERDLANSANERYTLPEACVLLDEMLVTAIAVLDDLQVYPRRMRENLDRSRRSHLSEAVLLAMIDRGTDRLDAYRILQRASAVAAREERDLVAVLSEDEQVAAALPPRELAGLAEAAVDVGFCEDLAEDTVRRSVEALDKASRGGLTCLAP
ncbi:adenylosuccinate lyase [Streptomyces sp. NPDC127033]|uniref:adenylosuccinate lyase n=1 Tax=Streptomyces sp. NPDC127033 TaxID=3347110 RepID=UPI003658D114